MDYELKRKFMLVDLSGEINAKVNKSGEGGSANRAWNIYGNRTSGGWNVEVEFGRYGTTLRKLPAKFFTEKALQQKISGQIREGYKELDLEVNRSTPDTGYGEAPKVLAPVYSDPVVRQFVEMIVRAAKKDAGEYLTMKLDELSLFQIGQGRTKLDTVITMWNGKPVINQSLIDAVQNYYVSIPTFIPRGATAKIVAEEFVRNFELQQDRLGQLETIIKSITPTKSTVAPKMPFSGSLTRLDKQDPLWKQLADSVIDTDAHGLKMHVLEIFAVEIPDERKRYEGCEIASNIVLAHHGTRKEFLMPILDTGLICPPNAANGRAFGNGIYIAPHSSKSLNYVGYLDKYRLLFKVEAKLGNWYNPYTRKINVYDGDLSLSNLKPHGYESVWAKGGQNSNLRYDEIIVYRREQQTIKYLIVTD